MSGRPETIKMVREIMEPIGRMEGDRLPVSVFIDHADGQFELGASAYEKRGVAAFIPEWQPDKCIQCNNCAYACPHACIRPFALTDAEAAAAPEGSVMLPIKAGKGKGVYQYSLAISPGDCMGCEVCVSVCPTDSLVMQNIETQLARQPIFDYLVAEVSEKTELVSNTVKDSQYKRPLLEFSGACAGCAQTSYARLVTQMFGDRMFVANSTGCSSIWGNPAATSPYTTDANGRGPAWCNSLFEDNAEFGMGMKLGHDAVRTKVAVESAALLEQEGVSDQLKEAATAWLDARDVAEQSKVASAAYVEALRAFAPTAQGEAKRLAESVLANKDFLVKKSFWIFGGDGWAYDIGFGGLDHVLASGEDVNVFVFDTEVYSNTGGQSSKASNIGQVAQFAAAGKDIKKKSLAEIAMSYGYVYVAQVAMGAKPAQTIKAIAEAEAYPGPSLIIGYSPCEMHSIKGGMAKCHDEMKAAVDCGYWNLFRFNPEGAPGKRFVLDSKAPAGGYQEFLMNEARYSRLVREFPDRAPDLFERNEAAGARALVPPREAEDGVFRVDGRHKMKAAAAYERPPLFFGSRRLVRGVKSRPLREEPRTAALASACQQFLRVGQLHAADEHVQRLVKFVQRGQGGGYPDVGVSRVASVGPGCACCGHGYARLGRKLHDARSAPFRSIEGYEIASLRVAPAAVSHIEERFIQFARDQLELGAQDGGVAGHVPGDSARISEEAYVAKLVELVVSDRRYAHMPSYLVEVIGRGGQRGKAGSRKCHLRGGRELQIAPGGARLSAGGGDVEHVVLSFDVVEQMVHAVCVVPYDSEVWRGALHVRQTTHRGIGVGGAAGIGVLGHAPYSLDGVVVAHEVFDQIHVGPLVGQRHGDHLESQRFGDGEMPIVSRNRTEPFHLSKRVPGSAPVRSEQAAAYQGVVHKGEARRPSDDDVFGGVVKKHRHEALRLGQAVQHSVVAAVQAAICGARCRIGYRREHGHAEIKLIGSGFSARHVQREPARLHGVEITFEPCRQRFERIRFQIRVHKTILPLVVALPLPR